MIEPDIKVTGTIGIVIKAIIFDCFGVLTEEAWHSFLSTLSPEHAAEAQSLMQQSSAGLMEYRDFIANVAELSGHSVPEISTLLRSENSKNLILLAYIEKLKCRGYTIGLLSNIANNWIRETFLTAHEQSLFDAMIFSYELGITKPDPRIFMLACERLRIGPHEAVMIDDIDRYIDAAKQEGLQGIVYTDFHQMKQDLEALLNSNN